MDPTDLIHRFTYHAPDAVKAQAHDSVRRWCRDLADFLNRELPEGREKSLAMTHLEEVMMWANAALARDMNSSTPPKLNINTSAPIYGPPPTLEKRER